MKNLNSVSYFKMFALGCLLASVAFLGRAYADTTNGVLKVRLDNNFNHSVSIEFAENNGLNVTQLLTSLDGSDSKAVFQITLTPDTNGSFAFIASEENNSNKSCRYGFNIKGGKLDDDSIFTETVNKGDDEMVCDFLKDWGDTTGSKDDDDTTADEGVKFLFNEPIKERAL